MALTLIKKESLRRIEPANGLRRLGYELLRLFFGCLHWNMSRPFTRDGRTFCVCLRCGMRRNFDLQQWKLTGDYYYGRDLSEYRERAVRKGKKQ